jgi:uncharacterized protein VirK/YbjX
MVFVLLTRHWLARRHYPLTSWMACVARSARVLLFPGAHLRLLGLAVYRDYVCHAHDDVFHHLSHRHYLVKGLRIHERVRCVATHYRFEDATFDTAYKRAVYRDGGLTLWRHDAGGKRFAIRLQMANRLNAEGDLTLAFLCDDACLHRLSFSWVDGRFAGVDAPIVPFVARNQGHRGDAGDAIAGFEAAFPNNSPSFFCAAALNGVARALGMDRLAGVKSTLQSARTTADAAHFTKAYDDFWHTLGGVEQPGRAWHIALPFALRPLSAMPSKHRKRAAMRREHWGAIAGSARLTLAGHVVPNRSAHADATAPCADAVSSVDIGSDMDLVARVSLAE